MELRFSKTTIILKEIYSALKEGNTRALSRLLSKTQLKLMSILNVEKKLDEVLRCDGNYDLSKTLMSVDSSQEKSEKKIN